ncbi:MAG: MarR family transcriptional regulator [Dehalococcoidia bacterium]
MPTTQSQEKVQTAVQALVEASALLDPLRLVLWDREGLTVTQLRLLGHLYENEGMGNAELADRLYVTRPSVSALLERLERGQFIRREVSPNDRRGIRIFLEERGRNVVASLRAEFRQYVADLMESMPDDDLDLFAQTVEKFLASGRARRARDLRAEHGE